jgi:serine/threonine protein phosphatase PrpC
VLRTFFNIDYAGLSDIGLTREKNEDAWNALPNEGFFILADGMGGHNAGEVASQIAVERLSELALENNGSTLSQLFQEVNATIYAKGEQEAAYAGMGTTLICLDLSMPEAICAHVGDSRLYLYRHGKLSQLTKDHSLASEMGNSSADFPYKHVLTKAMGTNPKVEAEITPVFPQNEDIFLLCTDGMTNYASDREIESTLRRMGALEEGVLELIELAKKNGGGDNITVLLVKIHGLS